MMRQRFLFRAFLFTASAGFMIAGGAAAQPAGDAEAGLRTARMLCADCHAVQKTDVSPPGAEAPTFVSIAQRPGLTLLAIHAFLRTSHRTMPNLVLDDREIDNLAVYFQTLK